MKKGLKFLFICFLMALSSLSIKGYSKEKGLVEFKTPAESPSFSIDGTPGCVEVKLKSVIDNEEKIRGYDHDPVALTYVYSIKMIKSHIEGEDEACRAKVFFRGTWTRPSDASDHVDSLIIEVPSMNQTLSHSRVAPSI